MYVCMYQEQFNTRFATIRLSETWNSCIKKLADIELPTGTVWEIFFVRTQAGAPGNSTQRKAMDFHFLVPTLPKRYHHQTKMVSHLNSIPTTVRDHVYLYVPGS